MWRQLWREIMCTASCLSYGRGDVPSPMMAEASHHARDRRESSLVMVTTLAEVRYVRLHMERLHGS